MADRARKSKASDLRRKGVRVATWAAPAAELTPAALMAAMPRILGHRWRGVIPDEASIYILTRAAQRCRVFMRPYSEAASGRIAGQRALDALATARAYGVRVHQETWDDLSALVVLDPLVWNADRAAMELATEWNRTIGVFSHDAVQLAAANRRFIAWVSGNSISPNSASRMIRRSKSTEKSDG